MGKDVYDFIIAVLEQLHGWISGGLLALGVELLDRIWGFKIPRKPWIAIFIVGGLVVSVFGAWRQEHEKVRTQSSYMSIDVNASWVPRVPTAWMPNKRATANFGKENATSYPAAEETSIQELIIRPAPFPLTGPFTPENNPTSPELETSAWEEMIKDREQGRHITTTYDPGEKNWASALTKEPLSQAELDRIQFQATDMVYVVGLDKWKSGNEIHGKSFCYWLHPQRGFIIVMEKCETHNDYIEDATEYLKLLK